MFRKPNPDVGRPALSLADLAAQKKAIEAEIASRGEEELESLKQQLAIIADAQGVSIQELFAPPKKERKKSEVRAKYMNPENPGETWSGRGKPPKWMQGKLDDGATKEQFLIN